MGGKGLRNRSQAHTEQTEQSLCTKCRDCLAGAFTALHNSRYGSMRSNASGKRPDRNATQPLRK